MDLNRRDMLIGLSKTLVGVTSAGTLAAIVSSVSSCDKADQTLKAENPIANKNSAQNIFSHHQSTTVNKLVDIILPRSDTPGAVDAGVPTFIEDLVQHTFEVQDQENFSEGLFSLDLIAKGLFESNFIEAKAEHQLKLAHKLNLSISELDSKHLKKKVKKFTRKVNRVKNIQTNTLQSAQDYFATIKALSIFGFFTSEIGASEVLQYNPIPGDFQGCVPLSDVGRAWATP